MDTRTSNEEVSVSTLAGPAVAAYPVLKAEQSYAATMRTSEIAIRMALGADRLTIMTMVLREAGILVCAGVAVGVLGAIGITRILAKKLFGLTPTDPLAYLIVCVTLLAVAASAALIPARRASRIDPIRALREE
jgi:ABC-type antimicrobial peptide transport system permease subunit